ncbi:hypothetical protein HOG21_05220 [bacterium]|nr:hypothetical protein [bacterium]
MYCINFFSFAKLFILVLNFVTQTTINLSSLSNSKKLFNSSTFNHSLKSI